MPRRLSLILIPLALAAVAFGMRAAVAAQRQVALDAATRVEAASRMLTAELDKETGLRGFLLTGQEPFLRPFQLGTLHEEAAERDVAREADGDPATLRLLAEHERVERRWTDEARTIIAGRRRHGRLHPSLPIALQRKALMDRLRKLNARLQTRLEQRRDADLRAAGNRATLFIVLLTGVLGAAGWLLLRTEAARRRRADRRELDYRASQRDLADALQGVRSEAEAHALLVRHLERHLPGARAAVVAQGRRSSRSETGACEPLVVGGEAIGAVRIEHPGPLDEDGERRLADSVAQAAPVLANLRNLALAEHRAATDALTGLPNRRAIQDQLRRMGAHAARTEQPLTALSIDLDRFKDVNDRHGHDMGDAVLAQAAATLTASIRASDFAGRLGGEELVVLATDTGVDGGVALAEAVRGALEAMVVPGLDRPVTASIGVAVLPDHAGDPDALLRASDRAMYAAKAAGRNRVEVAGAGIFARAV